jgi:enoyl-CoA hydratase/carnithine racemase
VAVLTIDHPPVNSLSQPMRYALWTALEEADADDGVHSIVLTGAGRGFCAGGDLGELRSPRQQAWPGISNHLLPRIEACAKPVIAALHGFAIGGGLEQALACHHRLHNAPRIALPEMKHGVVPPSGLQCLPRAAGVDRALALIVPAGHGRPSVCRLGAVRSAVRRRGRAGQLLTSPARAEARHTTAASALLRHHWPIARADAEAPAWPPGASGWRPCHRSARCAPLHRCGRVRGARLTSTRGLPQPSTCTDQLAGLAIARAALTGSRS